LRGIYIFMNKRYEIRLTLYPYPVREKVS